MISLRARTAIDIKNNWKQRALKNATVLDEDDYDRVLERTMRVMNDVVHNPRNLLIHGPIMRVDLSALNAPGQPDVAVDEILNVMFSAEQFFNQLLPEVGILPFLLGSTRYLILDTVVDYLALKGSLNILSRQLRTAPDWEYYPPILQFNGTYNAAKVEYLPYFDPSLVSWWLFENEYRFVLDYGWTDCMMEHNEALYGAAILGAYKEAGDVLNYWTTKKQKLYDDFVNSAIIVYE